MERVEHIVVDFSELKCKKCGNYNPVKAGYLRGKQRYKCKSCGYVRDVSTSKTCW